METKDYMDKLFHPKSIAIIEASRKRIWQVTGMTGRGYQGSLYLVSKKEKEIAGMSCHGDISELPDKIDLAIISIKRDELLNTIKKCIEKQFYTLHIFSAGLGEYDKHGVELERELFELLRNSNIRAIGPNCMGVYSTGGRISYNPYFSMEECINNCVAFVSHSGDLTTNYVEKVNDDGVKFSYAASIGNSVSLRFADFLQYFGQDEGTKIIAGYFEGFSQFRNMEGREMLEVLKNFKKPMLLLRGGVTKQGKRSVKSHTGTIASSSNIWDGIFAQTNVIKLNTYEELIDTTLAFYYCNDLPKVNGLILITWSGGNAVLGVDQIIKLGINVPEIKEPTKSKLKSMISTGSVSNPLDLPWIGREGKFFEICGIAINEPYVGGVILETFAPMVFEQRHDSYYDNILKIFNHSKKAKKPFLISLPYANVVNREKLKNKFIKDGIPVFPSMERAARAFSNLYKFQEKL